MSDTWSYTLFFVLRQLEPSKTFHSVIDAAGLLGYSCQAPLTVMRRDGTGEIEFSNYAAASSFLHTEGGSIHLVRDCESCEDDINLLISLSFDPNFKKISMSSTIRLHDKDWDRIELAHDLRKLWHILANRLKPLYGYGARETQFEYAVAKSTEGNQKDFSERIDQFYQRISENKPPLVLFGQNYFDSFYYDLFGDRLFSDLPHRKYILPEEYVGIYLSEFPWDSRLAVLGNDGQYHLVEQA